MTMDLSTTITPDSSQLNADDLMAGPITVTIQEVAPGSDEQPVNVHLVERPGRPYKPSKSMRRILVAAWGKEASVYAGRRLTLYRNPDTKFGREVVGGIEISHMSHLDRRLTVPLTVTRGKKRSFVVQPLPAEAEATFTVPDLATADEYRAHWQARKAEGAPPVELDAIYKAAQAITPTPEETA